MNQNPVSKPLLPLLSTIVTHTRPHLDELFAIWLIMKFGWKRWQMPDRARPRVVYVADDANLSDFKRSTSAVILGMGGGEFDEHKLEGRLGGHVCCSSLVARALGVDGWPHLRRMLEEVESSDAGGEKNLFGMERRIKTLHGYSRLSSYEIMRRCHEDFNAYYNREREFWFTCAKEFRDYGWWKDVNGFRLAFVYSNLETMNAYIRHQVGADVVVQANSNGHISVFCKPKGKDIVHAFSDVLLREEARRAGHNQPAIEAGSDYEAMIAKNGKGHKLVLAEHWYYHQEEHMLLNGGLTHPGVTPTSIKLEEMPFYLGKAIPESQPAQQPEQEEDLDAA